MDNISEILTSTIENLVNVLSDKISSKYSIPKEEIVQIWNDTSDLEVKLTNLSISTAPNKNQCQHILTSGSNKGNQCSKSISGKSQTGKYCLSHEKKYTTEEKIQSTQQQCRHIIERGVSKGSFCSKNASVIGKNIYCTIHSKKHQPELELIVDSKEE